MALPNSCGRCGASFIENFSNEKTIISPQLIFNVFQWFCFQSWNFTVHFIAALDKLIQRYELDEKVQDWSDYLATRFHPRTFSIVNQFQHNANAFNSFNQGVELWKSELFSEEWVDKCRAYVEECDYLQVCATDFWFYYRYSEKYLICGLFI